MAMRAIVTCGPSYEPIDEVRRLTNFSTGELGTLLAAALVRAGVETVCFRGIGATHSARPEGADLRAFTTNDDLAKQLEGMASDEETLAIFHAAALCDFRVARAGRPLAGGKIATRGGALTLRLEPTEKLLPRLRDWFPRSRIFGWKYEIDGPPAEALARARRQLSACRTDACILNGSGYGAGFALVRPNQEPQPFPTKEALGAFLAETVA